MVQYQECAYVRWHGMYQAPSEGCRYIEKVFYSIQVIHCVLFGHLWGHFSSNRLLQKKGHTFPFHSPPQTSDSGSHWMYPEVKHLCMHFAH